MPLHEHEVPTHLNVEDKAFYGLTARQLTHLVGGAAGGYGLWNQWPELPVTVKAALALACFAVAVVFALVRPSGRPLEEWAFVILRYAALPRAAVWRRSEPDFSQHGRASYSLRELAPHVGWGPQKHSTTEATR